MISQDTVIKGEIRDCQRMEVIGYFEGAVATKTLVVHPGGRFFGQLKAENAEIHGLLQGEIFTHNLLHVSAQGSVRGNIQYGRISIEPGGDLSAELRNIPPEIAGDMQISVARGQSVLVTTLDLTAIDPDDSADNLTYTVADKSNGHIAMSEAPQTPVQHFTQRDLEAGRVLFVHSGAADPAASFSVVVADAAGATSGAPQVVSVAVRV